MSLLSIIATLGPTVVLPIIITILGLSVGQKFGKAFRSGVTIGIGFAGIYLLIGYFWGMVAPVTTNLVEVYGFHLDIVDLGWPAISAIAWGWVTAPLIVIAILVTNVIMLWLKWTKTMDVDIWCFWGAMLLGAIAHHRTGSIIIGVATGVIVMIPVFLLADRTQKFMYDYYQIPNVSIPHIWSQNIGLVGLLFNWIIDQIPGINKIKISSGNLQDKIGVMGEPMIIGLVIGIALSAIARMGWIQVLQTGMGIAASMVLLPKMVSVLMEGLVPLAEAAGDFLSSKFEGREIFIGMDSAIMIGDPANITTAVLLVPIALVVAVILPFNRALPLGDLPSLLYMTVVPVAIARGNLFRTVLIGIPQLCVTLWVCTAMSPHVTPMAKLVGFPVPESATAITSVATGYYWLGYVIQEAIVRISLMF